MKVGLLTLEFCCQYSQNSFEKIPPIDQRHQLPKFSLKQYVQVQEPRFLLECCVVCTLQIPNQEHHSQSSI